MSDTAEVRKSDFFTSSNAVSPVPDSEYARVEPYVEMLECMSRLTYQSIYVIDYWKKNFLYVSDNPLFLCGRTRDEVLAKGYDFYFEVCEQSELAALVEINEAAFRFYNRLPVADRTAYSISYNFHIRDTVSGKSRLIHHKVPPDTPQAVPDAPDSAGGDVAGPVLGVAGIGRLGTPGPYRLREQPQGMGLQL